MQQLLEKSINFKQLPLILLIFGEEEFLVEEAIQTIIKKVAENGEKDFQFERYDAEGLSLNDIANLASTASLLAIRRTILIKNFEEIIPRANSKKDFSNTSFGKYLKNPSPDTFLILQANHSSLNGLSKQLNSSSKASTKKLNFPFDIIVNNFNWLEFPKLWPNEYPNWVETRAKKMGLNLQPNVVELLISKSGDSLRNLANELDKLKIYADNKTNISLEDIIEIAGASKESTVFDLQKAVGLKQIDKSVKLLIDLLENDRQEMLILAILQKFFLILWKLSELDININKYQLASQLGVNSFFLDDYLTASKKYPPTKIAFALNALMEADEQIKSSGANNLFIMINTVRKIVSN